MLEEFFEDHLEYSIKKSLCVLLFICFLFILFIDTILCYLFILLYNIKHTL